MGDVSRVQLDLGHRAGHRLACPLMPGSASEGKREALEMLLALELRHVLDVGPGRGTWHDLLATFFPEAHFEAIEIFAPYVERFKLKSKYERIRIGDASSPDLKFDPWEFFDLAIFGDVIEHIERERAVSMVWRLPWRYALISIPLGEYLQGPEGGNPAEAHVATWTFAEIVETFHPVQTWRGPIRSEPGHEIGVFLLERLGV